MTAASRTVVLTGASGRIGTSLRRDLPGHGWQLRSVDLVAGDGITAVDVTDPDALDPVVAGADAIVHLAGQPTEAPWPVIRAANLDGTYQVLEAARRHGVPRVVLASSNHAVGFTPVDGPDLPADLPPRPDTLYGVSKVVGEALGRYYVDRYGLRVACLRIGTFAAVPPERRALSTWLSPGDCARLVHACLSSPDLGYALVWGVSANTRRVWSLAEGRALGYEPEDDAEPHAGTLADDQAYPSDGFVGGRYTTPGYGIDEVAARWR